MRKWPLSAGESAVKPNLIVILVDDCASTKPARRDIRT